MFKEHHKWSKNIIKKSYAMSKHPRIIPIVTIQTWAQFLVWEKKKKMRSSTAPLLLFASKSSSASSSWFPTSSWSSSTSQILPRSLSSSSFIKPVNGQTNKKTKTNKCSMPNNTVFFFFWSPITDGWSLKASAGENILIWFLLIAQLNFNFIQKTLMGLFKS